MGSICFRWSRFCRSSNLAVIPQLVLCLFLFNLPSLGANRLPISCKYDPGLIHIECVVNDAVADVTNIAINDGQCEAPPPIRNSDREKLISLASTVQFSKDQELEARSFANRTLVSLRFGLSGDEEKVAYSTLLAFSYDKLIQSPTPATAAKLYFYLNPINRYSLGAKFFIQTGGCTLKSYSVTVNGVVTGAGHEHTNDLTFGSILDSIDGLR